MFSCISGYGQILLKKPDMAPDFKHLWLPGSNAEVRRINVGLWGLHGPLDQSRVVAVVKTETTNREYLIRPDLYYIQSGFFCKREWELEKVTHIPLRFRVGSLADCDAMEGKH